MTQSLLPYIQSLPGCSVQPGLYLIATPIGHMSDITLRALATLFYVDVIACEDTRVASKLLQRYQIPKKPLLSYHSHNENQSTKKIIEIIESGQSVGLISDAGTPLISDPGFDLISEMIERDLPITSIPGPCAAICALTLSGFPVTEFVFLGFLSRKQSHREEALRKHTTSTLVLYEAPHRILHTLECIYSVLGDRSIVIGRELTKRFEEVNRGQISALITLYQNKEPKGEFVIIIQGELPSKEDISDEWIHERLKIQSHKDLLKILVKDYHFSKNDAYERILRVKK
jgi:16S rRNA (cytidine1402-2'-O)-methyltransferase